MKNDPNKEWADLGHLVVKAKTEQLKKQNCPYCGNGLHFTYVPGDKAAIKIECKKCINRMWLDGVSNLPPWANEAGNTIQS